MHINMLTYINIFLKTKEQIYIYEAIHGPIHRPCVRIQLDQAPAIGIQQPKAYQNGRVV